MVFEGKEDLPIVLNENLIKLELFLRSVANLTAQETVRRHICHYKKDLIDLLLLFIIGIDPALQARARLVTANARIIGTFVNNSQLSKPECLFLSFCRNSVREKSFGN